MSIQNYKVHFGDKVIFSNIRSYILTLNTSRELKYRPGLDINVNLIFLYIYLNDIEDRKFKNILTLSSEQISDIREEYSRMLNGHYVESDDPHIKKLKHILISIENLYYIEDYVVDYLIKF